MTATRRCDHPGYLEPVAPRRGRDRAGISRRSIACAERTLQLFHALLLDIIRLLLPPQTSSEGAQ